MNDIGQFPNGNLEKWRVVAAKILPATSKPTLLSYTTGVLWFAIVPVNALQAKAWLAMSGGNRSIRTSRSSQYLKDMLAGRWRMHHQGVAFDENGVLVDGHHRLTAAEKLPAGVSIDVLVCGNLPDESKLHLDGNLSRNTKDALECAGESGSSVKALAVAKIIEYLPSTLEAGFMSREQEVSLLHGHADAIAFACQFHGVGISRGARTLIARAWYTEDRDRLYEFGRVLQDGQPVSANPQDDSGAITLRNVLISTTMNGSHFEREKYLKGQGCLRAFLDRQVHKKALRGERDYFPLPKGRRVLPQTEQ